MSFQNYSFSSNSSVNEEDDYSQDYLRSHSSEKDGDVLLNRLEQIGRVPSKEKFRKMICLTFVFAGACPYHDRCVFLHDYRIKCESAKIKTTKQYKSNAAIKDTFYWPDMTKREVGKHLDQQGLPTVHQMYQMPETFRYNANNFHNRGLYSIWSHFIDFCIHNNIFSIKKKTLDISTEPFFSNSSFQENPYVPGAHRLDVFVKLSLGKSFSKEKAPVKGFTDLFAQKKQNEEKQKSEKQFEWKDYLEFGQTTKDSQPELFPSLTFDDNLAGGSFPHITPQTSPTYSFPSFDKHLSVASDDTENPWNYNSLGKEESCFSDATQEMIIERQIKSTLNSLDKEDDDLSLLQQRQPKAKDVLIITAPKVQTSSSIVPNTVEVPCYPALSRSLNVPSDYSVGPFVSGGQPSNLEGSCSGFAKCGGSSNKELNCKWNFEASPISVSNNNFTWTEESKNNEVFPSFDDNRKRLERNISNNNFLFPKWDQQQFSFYEPRSPVTIN